MNGPRKRKFRWSKRFPQKNHFRIALVGQPNVGKSVIFNNWTGLGAIVSNYPGTTVEILEGTVYLSYHDVYSPRWHPSIKNWESQESSKEERIHDPPEKRGPRNKRWRGWRVGQRFRKWAHKDFDETFEGVRLEIVDLPGSYTIISPSTDDEKVTLRYLQQDSPDVIVNVVDATNLPRNLLLTIALLEFNIPMVVCLNQVDLARRMGIEIDEKKLEALLGVPVISTVAIYGTNLKLLLRTAAKAAALEGSQQHHRRMLFPDGIEAKLHALEQHLAKMQLCPLNLPLRIVSQQLLEKYAQCAECIESRLESEDAVKLVETLRKDIEEEFDADIVQVLGEKRAQYAVYLTEQVQSGKGKRVPLTEKISAVLTHRIIGLPIAVLVLIGSILLMFAVGAIFEATIGEFWEGFINPSAEYLITTFLPSPIIQIILYYGLVLGIQAWVFIAVPFVGTFYIILSVLEDTGYMARIAFLLDAFMHRLGLHGRAIIPLLTGMGCNVPAILGTRILTTRRERLIAGFLVVLVPCSAQLAVILGTVGLYSSIFLAFIILALIFAIIIGFGALLQHTLPGASHGLVMEIPPLRAPRLRPTIKKVWIRFREFVYIALPLIIIGGAILGLLLYYPTPDFSYLHMVSIWAAPLVVGWLGLPPETAAAFVYGILRKELTVELLVILANGPIDTFMSVRQMFVFALVTTIYIPCIATIAVLVREYRWKYTLMLAFSTIALAFFIGGIANWILLGIGFP
ncbi:MAG: ferrous iron transport protein B [Candidatus Thorarchaeota archaeon]